MAEYCFFEQGTIPEYTTPEWYAERESAPHLEQEMHTPRLHLAAEFVKSLIVGGVATKVVDLGAGDGGLLSLLPGIECWGYDLQQTNVDAAKNRSVDVRYGNVFELSDEEFGDVVVATEMIEHLVNPHGFVKMLSEKVNYVVASSPWTETPEAHYGYHTWGWDVDGYAQLFNHFGFEVVRHETTGMFQVLLGRTRG